MRAEQTSFLFGANAPFIEELYGRYVADAGSVDPEWRTFFEALSEQGADVLAEIEKKLREGLTADAAAPSGKNG